MLVEDKPEKPKREFRKSKTKEVNSGEEGSQILSAFMDIKLKLDQKKSEAIKPLNPLASLN